MPDSPERDFSAYTLSSKSPDQFDGMAGELATKSQPYVKDPLAKFLAEVTQIPEVDAVAVQIFPGHLAVEWSSNISEVKPPTKEEAEKDPDTLNPKRGVANHGTYIELADRSTARVYDSSIIGVQQVYAAFSTLREALRPAPFAEGKGKDIDPALNEISTIHHHNNPGGDPNSLIDHYLKRRRDINAFPDSAPDSSKSSFIALGLVDHPDPITYLADIPAKDTTIDKSLGVTFVGQGAQSVGMAKEVAQRYMMGAHLVHIADDVLGYPLSKLMFKGPLEELTRTEHAQPAIYTATFTNFRVLRAMGLLNEPAVLAGSSLGEYTAYAVAGVFGEGIDGFVEGLKVVKQRGILMQEADDETGPSGLAAVSIDTTDQQIIDEFIRNLNEELGITGEEDVNRIVPTNINSNGQLIIGGRNRSLKESLRVLEARKTKATRLNVSAAFHSHLMTPARIKMEQVLDNTTIYPVENPDRFVFANATGGVVRTAEQIRQALKNQVDSTVLYRDMIREFPSLGVTRIAEPGSSVQTGINLSFYKGNFAAETGKIELPGGIVAANYIDLSEKEAA